MTYDLDDLDDDNLSTLPGGLQERIGDLYDSAEELMGPGPARDAALDVAELMQEARSEIVGLGKEALRRVFRVALEPGGRIDSKDARDAAHEESRTNDLRDRHHAGWAAIVEIKSKVGERPFMAALPAIAALLV